MRSACTRRSWLTMAVLAALGLSLAACGSSGHSSTTASSVSPGLQLQPPEAATTVRVEDGKTLTTDGPFVTVKEALGGYFVYEADDLDAAIELASRIPAARLGGAVEVRPVKEG